jgi:hypothetical protein
MLSFQKMKRARTRELTLLRLADAAESQPEASLIGCLGTLVVIRFAFAVSLSVALSFALSFPLSAALSFARLAAVG